MPKRWLSRNGRHNNNTPIISSPKPPLFHNNHDFDFAFTELHSHRAADAASLSALPSAPLDDGRPKTSGGLNERTRVKTKALRIDVLSNRPKTSDGPSSPSLPLAEPEKHRSQSEEDLIGVAFGSPSHPPMAFCNNLGDDSQGREDHVFGLHGPFPEQSRLQPAKWKKLGSLFRAKQAPSRGKQQEEFERVYGPAPRHHWYKPRSHTPDPIRVPPTIRIDREHAEKLHEGSEPKTVLDLEPSPPPALTPTDDTSAGTAYPRRQASLPKLNTRNTGPRALPSLNSSSSLLARRSRTLENLKSQTFLRVSSDESEFSPGPSSADRPHSARRQTTPTMSNPPPIAGLTKSSTHSPAASKYSLFPPAPAGKIIIRSPGTRLERSNTSPARLSPAQTHFPAGECPAQQRRGIVPTQDEKLSEPVSSPEEHTASTKRTEKEPWSAGHSDLSSSVSSTTTMEEIFFDIKSFRDSRGVDQDDQFVMTRPDSVQVSLARTRSKLNAASRTDKGDEDETQDETETVEESKSEKASTTANSTPNPNDSRFSVSTAIFDETIAAVEAMSLPAAMREKALMVAAETPNAKLAQPQAPQSKEQARSGSVAVARARLKAATKHDLSIKLLPPDPGLPLSRASGLRNEILGRATPSPIPEEPNPRSTTPALSPEKKGSGASRTPSPNPILAAAEHSLAVANAVIEALEKDAPASWQEQKRQMAASTAADSMASRHRAESPVTVRAASPAAASVQKQPLSATSQYSQPQRTPLSAASVYSQPSPMSATSQGPAARLKQQDRPIEESPTIPQSPGPGKHNPNRATLKEKPPPVPVKDAKFIPLSKFASKNTLDRVEMAGVTPARITRSATEGSIGSPTSFQSRVTGYRTESGNSEISRRPLRSETMPSSNSPMLSQAVYRPSPTLSQQGQYKGSPQLRGGEGIMLVQAKPAAEVSVARTVSLARKQSAKVLVPGPKLQARRLEEEAKQQQQKVSSGVRSATPTGLGLVMGNSDDVATHQSAATSVTTAATMQTHHKQSSTSSIDRERNGPLNSNPSTPGEYVLENPVDRAEREKAQKAAIVEAAKARARARRAESQTRELRELAEREKEKEKEQVIEKYRDSQAEEDRARWEILEKRAMSPLLVAGHRGHKPGVSVNVVLESA